MLLGPMEGRMKIVHRPGLTHSNVDPLSRHLLSQTFFGSAFTSSFLSPALLDELRDAYPSDDTFRDHFTSPATLDPLTPADAAGVPMASGSDTASGTFQQDMLGLLFYISDGRRRLCVPLSCRLAIIRSLHDEMGHPGAKRTLAKASECI